MSPAPPDPALVEAGPPVEAPDELAPRFEGDALKKSVRAALAETGIEGEVSDVECDEFPCLLYGRIELGFPPDHSKLRALIGAVKEGYEGDNFYVSQSVFEGGSEGDYLVFSASFYPDDLPRDDTKRMEKRMQHRKNAYMDAARR